MSWVRLHSKNGCLLLFNVCLWKTWFITFHDECCPPQLLSNVTSEHWLDLNISDIFNPYCMTKDGLQDSVADSYRNVKYYRYPAKDSILKYLHSLNNQIFKDLSFKTSMFKKQNTHQHFCKVISSTSNWTQAVSQIINNLKGTKTDSSIAKWNYPETT